MTTPKRSKLRAVAPGETKPGPRKKLTVSEAVDTGDQLTILYAMRDRVAATITKGCDPRDLATLTKRLGDMTEQIKTLERTADDDVDDFAARVPDEPFNINQL